jgi:two-component system copper resistance phosphate regulon response regulator CusR
VLLDIMLPKLDGYSLCAEVRRSAPALPILMITAKGQVDDRVTGLDAGADDYLAKPFAFKELVARLRALGRRRESLVPRVIKVADLEVAIETQRVTRAGKPIELTAKEFGLLEFFVLHAGQVVDRASITSHVWDENHDPFTNVLEVLVRRLRRKIDDDFEPKLLQTIRGAGYRLGA